MGAAYGSALSSAISCCRLEFPSCSPWLMELDRGLQQRLALVSVRRCVRLVVATQCELCRPQGRIAEDEGIDVAVRVKTDGS